MCGIVGPIMENKDRCQGDLSDIIRASYGSTSSSASFSHDHWMLLSDPMDFSCVLEQDPRCSFGDPFSNTRDPFLHELHMPAVSACSYFNSSSSGSAEISGSVGMMMEEAADCFGGAGGVVVGSSEDACVLAQENIIVEDDMMMRRPCNNIIFSNMIQISPKPKLPISTCDNSSPVMAAASPRVVKPSSVVSGNMVSANTSKDHCLVDNTGVQISSPRNNPAGLKRRKSQAKKSICIPAPAAPNSRQSGEVVPSDLWAWRKYGQKPIKGSPYPRGYYRCSSSKGCPARKQVERSRTDPNMLVITYTSEHNHPWPTQRNVLAGSSRSQPSKNINNIGASKNNSETTELHKGSTTTTTTKPQEEEQESNTSDSNVSPVVAENSENNASVKEEIDGMVEKQLEMDDDGEFSNGLVLPYKNKHLEDFFSDDDEYSLKHLLSAQGFINAVDHDHQQRESKGSDPFHVLHHWSGDNSTRYHLI